jgi:dihydroflavonol-4-reductase
MFATPTRPDYNEPAMKALVTGSTGFLGANLVEGLAAAGHEARALQRSSSRLDALAGLTYEPVIGDVLDPRSLAAAMNGVDWVFHVAAVADYWRQGGTAQLYRVNVGGTRLVLEAALAASVRRVVFTSSAFALGVPTAHPQPSDSPSHPPPREQNAEGKQNNHLMNEAATFNLPATLSPYGHSKHLAEKVVHEFVARGLEVVIVNPTAILGPRDLNLVSGSLVLAVYRRQVPAIPPGGINYVDVADVVAGHIAAAERGASGERYILGAHNLTHRQAVTTIARVVGVPPPRVQFPGPMLGPLAVAVDMFNRVWPGAPLVEGNQVRLMKHIVFYDCNKAQQTFGLGPPIPFAASVERTLRWYQDNGHL